MIVLIGESASGKSTIETELTKKGLHKIVSYTTRPIRQNEKDGVDYHYITKDKFETLLSENFFAEHTQYNGWCYGIAQEDCVNDSVVVIEPYGLRQLKRKDNLNIISFYIKVSEKERLIRIAQRDNNTMEIFRRVISDQGLFQGIEDEVDYIIDGEQEINGIVDIISSTIKGVRYE